jgi:hypothetical protein
VLLGGSSVLGGLEGEFRIYLLWSVFIIKSNIGLCVSAKVSFVCCFFLLK